VKPEVKVVIRGGNQVEHLGDEEIWKKIMDLHEEIRATLDKIVAVEPTSTKPGRLNVKLASKARELEQKQWKLIDEILKRHCK